MAGNGAFSRAKCAIFARLWSGFLNTSLGFSSFYVVRHFWRPRARKMAGAIFGRGPFSTRRAEAVFAQALRILRTGRKQRPDFETERPATGKLSFPCSIQRGSGPLAAPRRAQTRSRIPGPFLTRAEKWHFLALSGTISGALVSDLPYRQRLTILRRPISATYRCPFAPTSIVLRMIPSRNIKARNHFGGQRLTWHWRVDAVLYSARGQVSRCRVGSAHRPWARRLAAVGIAHPTMAPLGAMQWIKAARCGSALNRIYCRNKQTSLDGKSGSKWQCFGHGSDHAFRGYHQLTVAFHGAKDNELCGPGRQRPATVASFRVKPALPQPPRHIFLFRQDLRVAPD